MAFTLFVIKAIALKNLYINKKNPLKLKGFFIFAVI